MSTLAGDGRDVVLYELNEVPWDILDRFAAQRSQSNVAKLLHEGRCQTTQSEEPNALQPWRTWPTFHKAMYSDDHRSFELGQDPATFRGKDVWDVAEDHGLPIGVFGPLQSWPAHEPRHGGFYVPDTFSRSAEVYPPSLRVFQEFNLAATRDQGFSSNAPLDVRQMLLVGSDLLRKGLTPWSIAYILRHLARERRDERYKASRAIIQALPSFDLYWRLHRRTRPRLSVFFTNHVAGMMHRYWGDAVEEYSRQFEYAPDEVFNTFLDAALAVFDHHLGRITRYMQRNPQTVLIVASSMGQSAVPPSGMDLCYVVKDPRRLASALGLGDVQEGLAMYPRTTWEFPTEDAARDAVAILEAITCAEQPLFADVRQDGKTLSCAIRIDLLPHEPVDEVTHGILQEPGESRTSTLADVGLAASPRLGGSNTAYHIPEGIMITFGRGIRADPSRSAISVLEAAPRIFDLLGIRDQDVGHAPELQAASSG